MKVYTPLLVPTMTLALLVTSCASGKVQRQLDSKIAQENGIKTRSDLVAEFDRLLKSASGLTDEQRMRLAHLRVTVLAHSNQLSQKSNKLKALLVRKLLTRQSVSNVGSDEVVLLKREIREVEKERLEFLFSAVGSVNAILGHWQPRQDRAGEVFYEQMMIEMMDPYYL